jgi:hypothetical protein
MENMHPVDINYTVAVDEKCFPHEFCDYGSYLSRD